MLVLTYLGFRTVPTGFIPAQDAGYLIVNLQMPDAATIDRTQPVMTRLAEIARNVPGVGHTVAISGFSILNRVNQTNAGTMFLPLRDFDQRKDHADQSAGAIAGRLMREYSQIQEGFALVLESRRDQYPLAVGLTWAEPDSDLGERLLAALRQAVDESKGDADAPRRIDFDIDGQQVIQLMSGNQGKESVGANQGSSSGDNPSGSPVLDAGTGRVIGIHHFGGVSSNPCLNSATQMKNICPDAGALLSCATN